MSSRRTKNHDTNNLSVTLKVLIGNVAYCIVHNDSIKYLLDKKSRYEFRGHRNILSDFIIWKTDPRSNILRKVEHINILRYLLSVFLRAYHRNLNHKIVMKRSHVGVLNVIFQ